MKPQKFLQRYKCDCFQPENICNCANKKSYSDALTENINDTAESLIEVMRLCGIREVKTKLMLNIIKYYFLHFEEIIYRIDTVPRKRFNKEDLMHDLGTKCDMSRKESQMLFSILKRAFKAFYHGTGQSGVPSRFKDKLIHSSECLWVHAAQRTAEVCARYEGLFYAAQKDLACRIKLVYKQLYDRMAARTPSDEDLECKCKKCIKRIRKGTLKPQPSTFDFHVQDDPYESLFLQEQEKLLEAEAAENETAIKAKSPCVCPSLSMTEKDYLYRQIAENTQFDKIKKSFECCWVSISREEFEAEDGSINLKLPEEFPRQPVADSDSEHDFSCEDCDCEIETNIDIGWV